jgi:hypothetical protein
VCLEDDIKKNERSKTKENIVNTATVIKQRFSRKGKKKDTMKNKKIRLT